MILDNLKNTSLYTPLGQRFTAAFNFLHGVDFASLAAGRTPIIGNEVFALRVDGPTNPESESLWEAHLRYADIHYQVSGGEAIGYAPVHTLQMTQPCEEGSDDRLFSGRGRFIPLEPGEFMILFPSDGHMPGVADGVHETSQKIVIKVLVAD
jgi:YhcH/YjgK/YiaL family protein